MPKYILLRTLAFISWVAGWIAIIVAAIIVVVAISAVHTSSYMPPTPFANGDGGIALVAHYLAFLAAGAIAGVGFWLIIVGELVQVFLDIEENTRNAAKRLTPSVPPATRIESVSNLANLSSGGTTCPNCASKNAEDARFCEQCGSAL